MFSTFDSNLLRILFFALLFYYKPAIDWVLDMHIKSISIQPVRIIFLVDYCFHHLANREMFLSTPSHTYLGKHLVTLISLHMPAIRCQQNCYVQSFVYKEHINQNFQSSHNFMNTLVFVLLAWSVFRDIYRPTSASKQLKEDFKIEDIPSQLSFSYVSGGTIKSQYFPSTAKSTFFFCLF